jgi:UPF0148 protein
MAAKKEDEIMAEYLLKGGKMLEKTCRQCGCPQFEYKGKVFCVVCAEREQEKKDAKSPQKRGEEKNPPQENRTPRGVASPPPDTGTVPLDEEIAAAIYNLCARIGAEEDPEQCLVLMDAVKIGAEALQIVRQL